VNSGRGRNKPRYGKIKLERIAGCVWRKGKKKDWGDRRERDREATGKKGENYNGRFSGHKVSASMGKGGWQMQAGKKRGGKKKRVLG